MSIPLKNAPKMTVIQKLKKKIQNIKWGRGFKISNGKDGSIGQWRETTLHAIGKSFYFRPPTPHGCLLDCVSLGLVLAS